MTADPARCIPILTSFDIAETLQFYRDHLGFAGVAIGDCAIVRRDAMELLFFLARDRIRPENTAGYIRGGQVPALYEEYAARAVPGLLGFEVKPWNMREFAVRDPHGNLLRFGCAA